MHACVLSPWDKHILFTNITDVWVSLSIVIFLKQLELFYVFPTLFVCELVPLWAVILVEFLLTPLAFLWESFEEFLYKFPRVFPIYVFILWWSLSALEPSILFKVFHHLLKVIYLLWSITLSIIGALLVFRRLFLQALVVELSSFLYMLSFWFQSFFFFVRFA